MIDAGLLNQPAATGIISSKRILSIDVFRALTMLLMLFVNDLGTLTAIPKWLEHAKADEDFLGVADVVFPCFLFIVGLSIPFAIRQQIEKGTTNGQIVRHIAVRSIALLVMGVFTVNVPNLNAPATGISSQWFQIGMVVAFFLIWNAYPNRRGSANHLFNGLQVLGVGILVVLAVVFRGGGLDHLGRMTPQWWGILGLIGWAYLTCAILYLLAYKRPVWFVLAWAFFTGLTVAGHAGWLRALWPGGPQNWILGNGAFHSFVFFGILASLLLTRFASSNPQKLPLRFVSMGILLLLTGVALRNVFMVSKIQATPPWIFLCCGLAFIVYAGIYVLVDRNGKANWFNGIKPAGTSALTCYLIPYLYYSLADLSGISLPEWAKQGGAGLLKSLLFAFFIIGITALLGRMKIKLNL